MPHILRHPNYCLRLHCPDLRVFFTGLSPARAKAALVQHFPQRSLHAFRGPHARSKRLTGPDWGGKSRFKQTRKARLQSLGKEIPVDRAYASQGVPQDPQVGPLRGGQLTPAELSTSDWIRLCAREAGAGRISSTNALLYIMLIIRSDQQHKSAYPWRAFGASWSAP